MKKYFQCNPLRFSKKFLGEKGIVATVLMDLSKLYDCIPHDLLIAKLNAYGIDSVGLLLISDYFFFYNILQKLKVETKNT